MKISGDPEKYWSERDIDMNSDWNDNSSEWVQSYQESINHSHRKYLINTISKVNPNSILEIGCNCGPNLYLLSKKYPNARIVGIDINKKAILKGKEWFAKEGITNVEFIVGKAEDISKFNDREFDVVFTDAILMYIDKDKVIDIIKDIYRIVNKKIVLIERMVSSGPIGFSNGSSTYTSGHWRHDYYKLFNPYVNITNKKQMKLTSITKRIWDNEWWITYGVMIEVYKK